MRCQNCSRCIQLSQATNSTIHPLPTSATNMRRRRDVRSATTPPKSRNNIFGAHCAIRIRLIAVAEPVRSRTSQVMAMVKTASPRTEMVCPVHSRVNGRERNARVNCNQSTNDGYARFARLILHHFLFLCGVDRAVHRPHDPPHTSLPLSCLCSRVLSVY